MPDIGGAFVWFEVIEQGADAPPSCFDCSLIGLSDECLEFGEHHLNGIEVWTVRGQEQEPGTDLSDRFACLLALMTSQIVEDDDVALCQGWDKSLLDPGCEGYAVDRPVQDERSDDTVMTQPGQEGQRLPMAVGHLGQIRLTTRAPAAGSGHVGLHPGFINEDQAVGVNLVLVRLPARPEPGQLRPILFLGHQRFF